jgi:hypothetical protein
MAVVDDLMTHIDGRAGAIESLIDRVDRPDDASTETTRLSENDLHQVPPPGSFHFSISFERIRKQNCAAPHIIVQSSSSSVSPSLMNLS